MNFRAFAHQASVWMASPSAFLIAVGIVGVWAFVGPFVGFTEKWQLVINTGTTIVTFLIGFLVLSSQARESKAINLKLDELVRCSSARNTFAYLEHATDEEIDHLDREFREFRRRRKSDRDDTVVE